MVPTIKQGGKGGQAPRVCEKSRALPLETRWRDTRVCEKSRALLLETRAGEESQSMVPPTKQRGPRARTLSLRT